MSSSFKMDVMAQHWAEALDKTEPELHLAASREQWLRRFETGVESRSSPRRRGVVLAMAALVAAMVAVFLGFSQWARTTALPTPGAWLEAAAGEQIPLDFSDGSRVMVHTRSRVHVRSVDPQGARVDLERGVLTASIVRRPDTNWAFRSGPFEVVVTGTKLRIEWDPRLQSFEVSVQEGSVKVTGPMLEQGRTVANGQRCRVVIPEARLEVTTTSSTMVDEPGLPKVKLGDLPLAPSAEPSTKSPSHALGSSLTQNAADPTWIDLERQARYEEAMAAAERQGLSGIYASGSGEELLTLARVARLSGRGVIAAQALTACRERYPHTPAAAQAAFLLGRAATPAAAATWFSLYLREAPGGPFAREAAGRLIESYSHAGNQDAARQAASAYLQYYPNGPHAAFARSIISASGN